MFGIRSPLAGVIRVLSRVLPVLPVLLALRASRVRLVLLAPLVLLDLRVLRAFKARLALLALWVRLVRLALPVRRDLRDYKVCLLYTSGKEYQQQNAGEQADFSAEAEDDQNSGSAQHENCF